MTRHFSALGHALWGVVRALLRLVYAPAGRLRLPAHRLIARLLVTVLLVWLGWLGWHALGRALHAAGTGARHLLSGAKQHGGHTASVSDWGLYVVVGAIVLVLAVAVAEWGHRRAKAARAEQGKLAEEARSHKAASGVWLVATAALAAVPTGLGSLPFGWRVGLCLGVLTLGFWRAWSLGGGAGDAQAGEAKWHAALRVAATEDRVPIAAVVVGGVGVAVGLASLVQYGGDVLLVLGMVVLAVRRGPSAQLYLEDERRFREVFAAAAGADKVASVRVQPVPGSPSGAVCTLTRDCGAPVVARTADVVRLSLGDEYVVHHDGVGRQIQVRPESLIATTAPMPTVPDTPWHVLPLGLTRADRVVSVDVLQDPHMLVAGKTGSGKTVAITDLATQALLRGWELAVIEVVKGGVDFKPLSPWCRVLATELEQAALALETVVAEVHRRRVLLDQHGGATKVIDLPEDIRPRPMLVVVDETFSLLSRIQSKTEAAQAINSVKDRIDDAIGSLAREARFASVHLILGMQRPDTPVFAGEIKANTGTRILCGQSDEIARRMCLRDVNSAPVVHRGAKGRAVIESEADDAQLVQVFYCPPENIPAVMHAANVPGAEPLELVAPAPKPAKGKAKAATGSPRPEDAPPEPKPAGRRPKSAAAEVVGDDGPPLPPLPPLGDVA